MEIRLPVEVDEVKWISIGAKVKLDYNDGLIWGSVSRVSGHVDPNTQSVDVYVKLLNQSNVLDGTYMNAIIIGKTLKKVVELPRSAVVENNKLHLVIDNMLSVKEVEIVKLNQETVFVKGIEDGTMVVTELIGDIKEGEEVNTIQ